MKGEKISEGNGTTIIEIGGKRFGYCRVSTKGQLAGNSVEEQTQAIKAKYPDAEIIVEAYSGAKERPIFTELLEQLQPGDTLVVTKLDRFCRSLTEGKRYIELLRTKGVVIDILNIGVIQDSLIGNLIASILLAIAEFERGMIMERTQGGKAIAKQKPDFREGRPMTYTPVQLGHAVGLLESNSYSQVAAMTGISVSTLQRAKKRREALK